MKLSIWFFVTFLAALVSSELPQETATLKTSLDHFSSSFYKHVAESKAGTNLVMSPLSAQIALAMLSMGAEGKTLEELQTSMRLPSKNFTKTEFKKSMSEYNDDNSADPPQKKSEYGFPIYDPKPPVLRVVNKVFVHQKYQLAPEYKNVVVDSFRSEIENVDFSEKNETAKIINSWVEEKTNKKIKNFVAPPSLGSHVALMLVNAVYFKASWKTPFSPALTRKDIFYLPADKTVQIDFLHGTSFYQALELPEWDASAIRLPFHGSDYSMLFIRPKKVDGLSSVENKLASADLGGILKRMNTRHIELSLPKFRIESTIDLTQILPNMGMIKMFTTAAEFYGMLKTPESLYVTDAKQQAFIEIDEYGCEAAAATKITMSPVSMPSTFRLNVPFYYAIVDGSGSRVFSGRYVNPN